MLETIKQYAKLIVGGLWVLTVVGAYAYRAYQDAGEVTAALNARKVSEDKAISEAEAKGRADTQKLADDQAKRANQAELELAKEKTAHANDIKAAHADLKAAVGKCRVARSDVRVLDTAPAVPSPAAAPANPAAGQQHNDAGTVGVVTVIETCERNKGHFDADVSKLEQCIADYNDVRSKLDQLGKGKAK